MGVFPYFSLTVSPRLTLSIISLSISLYFPPIAHRRFSLSHFVSLSAIFTATKGLSKQNSWTNMPWDEFHGGSWQQQAEGRGACQHVQRVVKI